VSEELANTDRELWRERTDDFYADSIHVTEGGGIGINVGGHVIVRSLKQWHAAIAEVERLQTFHDDIVSIGGEGFCAAAKKLRDENDRLLAENAALRTAADPGKPRNVPVDWRQYMEPCLSPDEPEETTSKLS
jgi:hypothetical protein